MDNGLFSATDIYAGYGGDVPVVNGVSFSLKRGEALSVIGPNGAGKSTLLKAVFGLVPHVRGQVRFLDTAFARPNPAALVKAGVGYVPQGHQVFPDMTVLENLEMGCYWMSRAQARVAVARVLDEVPRLKVLESRRAGVLSGGEQQLVSIGRALTHEPKVLLVDEPSAGLSPKNSVLIFKMLDEVRSRGMGIMLVEQNARMALEFADYGLVLDMGRVRFSGRARQLLETPSVRSLYIGGV